MASPFPQQEPERNHEYVHTTEDHSCLWTAGTEVGILFVFVLYEFRVLSSNFKVRCWVTVVFRVLPVSPLRFFVTQPCSCILFFSPRLDPIPRSRFLWSLRGKLDGSYSPYILAWDTWIRRWHPVYFTFWVVIHECWVLHDLQDHILRDKWTRASKDKLHHAPAPSSQAPVSQDQKPTGSPQSSSTAHCYVGWGLATKWSCSLTFIFLWSKNSDFVSWNCRGELFPSFLLGFLVWPNN